MTVYGVFVRYCGKDIKYDLDSEVPLETHVGNLCSIFNAPGLPAHYGLQISSTYIFLKPEVYNLNCHH